MNDVPPPAASAPAPPQEAVDVFGETLPVARRYADLLATTGISHGLVGPREAPRLWERHLVNCAVAEVLIPRDAEVADIGSGAGLPGLVLAIVRPDLNLELVEPLLRRTTWLEGAIAELGLANVTVHRGRAEEVVLSVPVVTARAVASLEKLVRWSFPLLEPGGRLLALKGEAASRELDEVRPLLEQWDTPGGTVHLIGQGLVSEPVRVVEITRPQELPKAFRREKGRARSVAGGAPRASRRRGGRRQKG